MDKSLAETLAAWRHHLHRHPELTLHEKETAAFVCARLRELGISYTSGIGGNGIVATISRGPSNRSVGLRADMDALPITETTGLPYASRNPGVMHACGHDGHTTSLLGAAALLSRDMSWTGTVHLVFQPAEEGGGGAKSMIADGLFARFPMERIFGYHNWPGLDVDTVAVHDSIVMGSGGRIEFRVKGRSGHAALPHLTRDPMVASAHLLLALQTIVARNVDPLDAAVITVATMEAGSAANQIAGEAVMRGTMRTLRNEVRDAVEVAIRRVAAGVAQSCDVEIGVSLRRGNPVTANSPAERELASDAALSAGLPLRRDMSPAMTGEDFAWYLQQCPGAFVWIGNGPAEGGRGLHSSDYDYNDKVLPVASSYLATVAKRALGC
jgi:hippurate hydrolase